MAIQKWQFNETAIKGLITVTPFNADDVRGCFTKDYSKEAFEANGIKHDLAEVFYTTSHKGVIRALHFQREKQQPKLVRCIYGTSGMSWSISARTARRSRCGFPLISTERTPFLNQTIKQSNNQTMSRSWCLPAVRTAILSWKIPLSVTSAARSSTASMMTGSCGTIRISE